MSLPISQMTKTTIGRQRVPPSGPTNNLFRYQVQIPLEKTCRLAPASAPEVDPTPRRVTGVRALRWSATWKTTFSKNATQRRHDIAQKCGGGVHRTQPTDPFCTKYAHSPRASIDFFFGLALFFRLAVSTLFCSLSTHVHDPHDHALPLFILPMVYSRLVVPLSAFHVFSEYDSLLCKPTLSQHCKESCFATNCLKPDATTGDCNGAGARDSIGRWSVDTSCQATAMNCRQPTTCVDSHS